MENALLDCFSLLGVGVLCKERMRWWRILLGTLWGVLAGALCLLKLHVFWLYIGILFVVVNPLMLQIAYGWMRLPRLLSQYGCCVVINLLLGGGMNFLRQMLPAEYFNVMLPVTCIISLPLVALVLRAMEKREAYATVSFLANGQVSTMLALKDTGNCLRDAHMGMPVCIVSEELKKNINLSEEKLRKIPYETISGCDEIEIYPVTKFYIKKKQEMTEQKTMLLGFGRRSMFKGKKYQMILHKDYC